MKKDALSEKLVYLTVRKKCTRSLTLFLLVIAQNQIRWLHWLFALLAWPRALSSIENYMIGNSQGESEWYGEHRGVSLNGITTTKDFEENHLEFVIIVEFGFSIVAPYTNLLEQYREAPENADLRQNVGMVLILFQFCQLYLASDVFSAGLHPHLGSQCSRSTLRNMRTLRW